jgi:hypothetical protein
MYWIGERACFVDDPHTRLLRFDHDALDIRDPVAYQRVQGHRGFDRGLRVKLGWKRDLEQHVLHDVGAERLWQRQRLPFEQDIAEAPGLGTQRGGVAHLTRERDEGMPHGPAGRIARRPTLARSGVRRVPIRPKRASVEPCVGDSIDDLLSRSAEHGGHDGCGGNTHQQNVIEAHAVEAVFEGEHALDLVRLDHGRENVANDRRLSAFHHGFARHVVRDGENSAEVVRRVSPLGREPRVVEIEPANHRPDIESRLHGLELERGTGHARPTRHERARHDGTEQACARRILQGLKAAGERVHETVAGGFVGLLAFNPEALRVIGYCDEQCVGVGALRGLVVECGHRRLKRWMALARWRRCRP